MFYLVCSCNVATNKLQNHPNIRVVRHYISFENEPNVSGIIYSVAINNIKKFDNQNVFSINFYGVEQGNVYSFRITNKSCKKHTDFLYLSKSKLDHYYLIKDFNRLMFDIIKYKGKKLFCKLYLQCFSQIRILNERMELCKHNETSRVEMYSTKVLKYTNLITRLKLLM